MSICTKQRSAPEDVANIGDTFARSAVAQRLNTGLAIETARVRFLHLLLFRSLRILFSTRRLNQLTCINELYMAIDSSGNVSEYIVFARNCSVGRMLLTDVELVSG